MGERESKVSSVRPELESRAWRSLAKELFQSMQLLGACYTQQGTQKSSLYICSVWLHIRTIQDIFSLSS